jgi:hypothetical protein
MTGPPGIGVNRASSDFWFDYLPRSHNFWGDLVSWTPKDGLWQIRLETATKAGHIHLGYSPWYNILINNEWPTGDLKFTTSGICSELFIGQTLTGVFYATMQTPAFFDEYDIVVLPQHLIPSPVVPSSGTSVVPPGGPSGLDPIQPWTLDTTNGTACGFVVRLHARALTVCESSVACIRQIYIDRGFCLRKFIIGEL